MVMVLAVLGLSSHAGDIGQPGDESQPVRAASKPWERCAEAGVRPTGKTPH